MKCLFVVAVSIAAGCGGSSVRQPVVAKPAPQAPAQPAGPPAHIEIGKPARLGDAKPEPILGIMSTELTRSLAELTKKGQAPYFASYEVDDSHRIGITAAFGSIESSSDTFHRTLDVDVRAGDYKFDNTHTSHGRARGVTQTVLLPLEVDAYTISTRLWLATDAAVKTATEQLSKVQAAKKVTVKDDDDSDDFSHEAPTEYFEPAASITIDRHDWEQRLAKLSAAFRSHPEVLGSQVSLAGYAETEFYVNSEGTRYQIPRVHVRISIQAWTRAADGMVLSRNEAFDRLGTDHLPSDDQISAKIERVIADLDSLQKAPVADPFSGPAILDSQAAAVFFHEVFGHRIEGHRQKDESEGQTFSKKLGQPITASFIDVYDDPSVATLNGVDLNGYYRYDAEGMPGQRASLIEQGVLKTFLMARSPTRGVTQSNGHGRRTSGHSAVARQGNLIVAPRATVDQATLKTMLLAEVKRQNKPYGLLFKELDGGFTTTERFSPQAFKLLPVMTYRVYPDGREELIRGADLEGTPLSALADIRAAGDDVGTFNGYCGAESGSLPVSANSPSILVAHVELTKKSKGNAKAPLLPAPPLAPEESK